MEISYFIASSRAFSPSSFLPIHLFSQKVLNINYVDNHLILECGGSLKPEVVEGTAFSPLYTASSIFVLSGQTNYWLAKHGKTTGQGFTMKVDSCARIIVGCQIKNLGKGVNSGRISREFRVSGRVLKCHESHKYGQK